jgi:FAD-dependent urate hydroxylase
VSSVARAGGVAQIQESNSASRVAECEVAVIGAGPYGLASTAHLRSKGIEARIFGKPMEFWADKMPAGMLLRSPRVASNISDPKHAFSLEAYEASADIKPQAPLQLATFVGYGRWFQSQLMPDLDRREVASIDRRDSGFKLILEDGESLRCKRVVVATGIGAFQRIPEVFRSLPLDKVSHCYSGCDVPSFANKSVAVIGAGQSALESAALLQEAGANVEVIARIPALRWIGMHSWLHNLGPISLMLYSQHDVGPAGISRLVAAPNLVKYIPLKLRDKIRTRAVRPAGSKC